VTERDPFGRLPNEDPLAGLGSRTNGTKSLAASEPPTTAESPAEAPADRPRPVPRRRSAAASRLNPSQVADAGRWIVRAVVIVGVLVTIAGVAGALLLADKSVPDEVSHAPAPRLAGDDPTPRGLDPRSLLLRRNLAPALRRLRRSGLGQLRTLRVAPERIDATLLARDGRLRSVRVRFDGTLSGLGASRTSGAGSRAPLTISFSLVDAATPSRLARSAAARTRRPVSEVQFVFLRNAGASASWTVVMRDGRRLRGDARGRIIGRTG